MTEPIYIEQGKRWSYAVALEWPGWCRHARGDGDPVAELVAVAPRYQAALAMSDIPFHPPNGPADLEVIEVLQGNSGTEWGVPSVVPAADERPLDGATTDRLAAILQATWLAFDRAVDAAQGHELRKGPRGGGRDLDALVRHCLESDLAYLRNLGSRTPKLADGDWMASEAAIRERAREALHDRAAGRQVRDPNRVSRLWTPRFYVRYVAWHALVHAWEIEDRKLAISAEAGPSSAGR
jgi:hypothetical protein